MSYVGITVMILAELVGDRWGKLGIILEICIAGIVIAGYINAYVTPRIPYKWYYSIFYLLPLII